MNILDHDVALAKINMERTGNGLPHIDMRTLFGSAWISETADHLCYSRDGWNVIMNFETEQLVTHPPENFNPRIHNPCCPFTGTLFNPEGNKTYGCKHEFESISDSIEQCWKCRQGRLKTT